jgi:SP family myo-inositol transporter-like MFS transporter 13
MVDRDEANAPLIEDREPTILEDDGHRIAQESETTSPSAFIWALTFAAGISGLLFGYDTGVISSTLVSIGEDLGHPLSTLDKSLITSYTSLGALVASPITGILADRFGRRVIILVADVLFIAGALGQAVTTSVAGMVVGRTVVGFAVGGASLVVPLYISELSPSAFRGRLVTLSILFITLGQVVAYFIGYVLSMERGGWKWMVGLGAAPAVLQFFLMLLLPESPRWLVKADKTLEARKILRKVYAAKEDTVVDEVLRAIKTEIAEEEATKDDVSTAVGGNKFEVWLTSVRNRSAEMFHVGMNRRALTIACLLQGLQQLCGFVSF